MNNKLEGFISALSRLAPADDDDSLEHTLYEIVGTIEGVEDVSPAYRRIFEFFERFPNAQHGSPGPLVHLIEQSAPAYFSDLTSSVARRPTPHTLWIVNRILNSEISSAQRVEFTALLDTSSRHPFADSIARERASGFLQHQRNRAT